MSGENEIVAYRVSERRFVPMDAASLEAHAAKHLGKTEEAKAWKLLLEDLPATFAVPKELTEGAMLALVSEALGALLRLFQREVELGRFPREFSELDLLLVFTHLPWRDAYRQKLPLGAPAVRWMEEHAPEVHRWESHPDFSEFRQAAQELRPRLPKSKVRLLARWFEEVQQVREDLRRFWLMHPKVLEAYRERALQAVRNGAQAPRRVEYVERGEYSNEAYLDGEGVYCVLHGGAGGEPHRLATAYIPYPNAAESVRREVAAVQGLIRQASEAPGSAQEMFKKHASKLAKKDALRNLRFSSPKNWGFHE